MPIVFHSLGEEWAVRAPGGSAVGMLNATEIKRQEHPATTKTEIRWLQREIMRDTFVVSVMLGALVFVTGHAFAQRLPPPSRTVFKCEVAGKTVYSDSPCLGAKKVDVEPTRGVSKLSGRERIGPDVRREQYHETMADALRPLTGMDAKQLDTYGRRMKLIPDDQQECRQLDLRMPAAENEEKLAKGRALQDVQASLFHMRRRFREVGC